MQRHGHACKPKQTQGLTHMYIHLREHGLRWKMLKKTEKHFNIWAVKRIKSVQNCTDYKKIFKNNRF